MLEEPKYLSTISACLVKYIKTYLTPIIIVIVAAATFEGWLLYQKHIANDQTQLQKENEKYKAQIQGLTDNYNKLASAKKDLETENFKLDADAQYWKKKASSISVLPKPQPPPVDDVTLISDLKIAGVEFKPLSESTFSTERTTLPTVWTWNKQALRVPSLEEKLAVTEVSATKFETLAYGYKKELMVADDMLSEADKRELVRKQQEANLNEQVKTEHKKVVAAEVNGWLKLGAGLAVGYLTGKAVSK